MPWQMKDDNTGCRNGIQLPTTGTKGRRTAGFRPFSSANLKLARLYSERCASLGLQAYPFRLDLSAGAQRHNLRRPEGR